MNLSQMETFCESADGLIIVAIDDANKKLHVAIKRQDGIETVASYEFGEAYSKALPCAFRIADLEAQEAQRE